MNDKIFVPVVPIHNPQWDAVIRMDAELKNLERAEKNFQLKQTEKQIKNQERIIKLLEDQKQNGVKRPEYLNNLIENGLIHIDGASALEGLDKIADYLINFLCLDFVSPELLMQFRKLDGDLFSINSAREAVKRAKNKEKNTD